MRTRIIFTIFAIVWLGLLVRIYYISIKSNDYYDKLANRNTIKIKDIPPIRGEILDINNQPIAINQLGFKIKLAPHLSKKSKKEVLEKELNTIIKYLPFLEKEKLFKTYKRKDSPYNYDYIDIVEFIPYEKLLPVYSVLNLRTQLQLEPTAKRYYPNDKLGAHIIGYVSKANKKEIEDNEVAKLTGRIGKSGIEKHYNEYLQGELGSRTIQVSAYNEEIEEISRIDPKEHRNLVLHVDLRLQNYISELYKGKAGAIVVMGINGEILAAGSYPEYDLNTFVSGISSKKWKELINDVNAPFTNKIINGLYPPGSITKTGIGLSFITSGQMNEWTSFYDTGAVEVGGRKFRCWKKEGHGKVNVTKAIRVSCDDYYYKASMKVGIKYMADSLKRYGLGQKTGIDLPREFIGTVPSRMWKRRRYNSPWYIGETLNTSIGQGSFLVTPIQMAQFTALMATGKLPRPHIAKSIGEKEIMPEFKEVLTEAEKKKLPIIQKAMYQVINHQEGTGRRYIRSKVKIAGKSGTAQVIGIAQDVKERLKESELAYFNRSHAWFASYAPYKKPKFIVSALVEHGGHGGQAAGPIVSKVYDKLQELGYLK